MPLPEAMTALGPFRLTRALGEAAWFWGSDPAASPAGRGTEPAEDGGAELSKHGTGIFEALAAIRAAFGIERGSVRSGANPPADPRHLPRPRTLVLAESAGLRASHESAAGTPAAAGASARNRRPPARFAALHESAQSSHIGYRFGPFTGREERERFEIAASCVQRLRHRHAQPIEAVRFDASGHGWILTPYLGDVDGVRTLSQLLREKQGQFPAIEVELAMEQLLGLLEAQATAIHADTGPQDIAQLTELPAPRHHGPLFIDQVLVDRHGSLVVELFGLCRLMTAALPDDLGLEPHAQVHSPTDAGVRALASAYRADLVADEVRSVARIGYQLLTGLVPESPLIPATRLVRRLDPRWDHWLARGCASDAAAFGSPNEALSQLPSALDEADRLARRKSALRGSRAVNLRA
jgi:hypothetical protein